MLTGIPASGVGSWGADMRNPAARVGLVYGLIGIVFAVVEQAILHVTDADPAFGQASNVIRVAFIVLISVLALLAGRAATAESGKVGSGAVAGLLTGLIAGLVANTIALVLFRPPPAFVFFQILAVLASVELVALHMALGAGAGAIGGLIGHKAHRRAAA